MYRLKHLPKWVLPTGLVVGGMGAMFVYSNNKASKIAPKQTRIPGKTVVITGATSGIGEEVAKTLAKRAGVIIMGCRDMKKCKKLREEIMEASFNQKVYCKELDLSSMDSIHKFAEDINKNEERVDILINNAAVMGMKEKKLTKEGIEMHFGVNYLGHFLLTHLLMDKLQKNAPSRVINMSALRLTGDVNLDDPNFNQSYSWDKAYQLSKQSMVLFTRELHRRYHDKGIHAFCVHPPLTSTALERELSSSKSWISSVFITPLKMMTHEHPNVSAQTVIYCATVPGALKQSGLSFTKCDTVDLRDVFKDEEKAKRLWAISERWARIS